MRIQVAEAEARDLESDDVTARKQFIFTLCVHTDIKLFMLRSENVAPQKKSWIPVAPASSYVWIQAQHQSISQSSFSSWWNRDESLIFMWNSLRLKGQNPDAVPQREDRSY